MKDIEDIGSIIGSVVDRMGINSKLSTSSIFNHWPEIVGGEIAKKSRPRKLADMTLHVSVTSSTWANELSLMSEDLIDKINAFAGQEVVKKIRFRADL